MLEKQGQMVTFPVPNNMMTGSQLKQEAYEFDRYMKLNEQEKEKKRDKYQVYTSKSKKENAAERA